jgi:hypothetical protein
MVSKAPTKQNVVQRFNYEFALASIIALVVIVFLPMFIDPALNQTSFDTITVYQKISDGLIAIFAILAVYTGVRGWEMATRKTHKTIYVTAISVGILAVVQFLWMGLPTILS